MLVAYICTSTVALWRACHWIAAGSFFFAPPFVFTCIIGLSMVGFFCALFVVIVIARHTLCRWYETDKGEQKARTTSRYSQTHTHTRIAPYCEMQFRHQKRFRTENRSVTRIHLIFSHFSFAIFFYHRSFVALHSVVACRCSAAAVRLRHSTFIYYILWLRKRYNTYLSR